MQFQLVAEIKSMKREIKAVKAALSGLTNKIDTIKEEDFSVDSSGFKVSYLLHNTGHDGNLQYFIGCNTLKISRGFCEITETRLQ